MLGPWSTLECSHQPHHAQDRHPIGWRIAHFFALRFSSSRRDCDSSGESKPRGRASLVVVSKVSPFAPFAPCKMDCLLSGEHDLEKCFAEAVEVGELPASGWPRFDFVLRRGNGTTLCSDHERSPGFFLFLRKDLLAATPMSRADYQWIEAKAGQTGWLFKAAQRNTIHRCSTTQHSHR